MPFGERFLSNPDLFPARAGGERWGEEDLSLSFGGGIYRFSSLTSHQVDSLVERFAGYLAPLGAQADCEVEVFRAHPEELLPNPAGELYRIEADHEELGLRVAGRNFMARVELWPVLSATLWLRDTGAPDVREGCENLLRVMAAYRALHRGGALFHSAALAREGQALLFPGHSGAGKSTLSGIASSRGWAVLSDELNLVVPTPGGGYAVEQVPFAGDFGRSQPLPGGPFPLAAVVTLEHAGSDALEPLAPGRTLAAILAAAPFVNADSWRCDQLVDSLEGMVRAVPGFLLRFRRQSGLEILQGLLENRALAAGVSR